MGGYCPLTHCLSTIQRSTKCVKECVLSRTKVTLKMRALSLCGYIINQNEAQNQVSRVESRDGPVIDIFISYKG